MPPFNDYTWHEIQSQPDAWAATLALLQARGDELRMFLRANPVSQVLYTGCGSTYYLALAAAAALRELAGLPAKVSVTAVSFQSASRFTAALSDWRTS